MSDENPKFKCEACRRLLSDPDPSVTWSKCPACGSEDVFRACPICKTGSVGDCDEICTNESCENFDPGANEPDTSFFGIFR